MVVRSLWLTFCAMLMSVALFAQSTVIEVQGVSEYSREVDKYVAYITVSTRDYYGYDDQDTPSLEELTKQFFEQVKTIGLASNRFEVAGDQPQYYTPAQAGEAVVYRFETTALDEMKRLAGFKFAEGGGIYLSNGETHYKPLANAEQVIADAVKDAEAGGRVIARALGRQLGKIVAISDQSRAYALQPDGFYDGNGPAKYYVLVKFEVE